MQRADLKHPESSIQDPVPIIAMTAHAMAGDDKKSIEAGMNDHVTKPIDPDQLFETLQDWIRPVSERAAVQKLPVFDVPPEPDQAVPDEDRTAPIFAGIRSGGRVKTITGQYTSLPQQKR